MTNAEWRTELEATLAGTEWILHSATITQGLFYGVAAVARRTTGETRVMSLPLANFRTPTARRAEILKQLSY